MYMYTIYHIHINWLNTWIFYIEDEAKAVYNELFVDTSLEVGKTLSKDERDRKNLNHEKVC